MSVCAQTYNKELHKALKDITTVITGNTDIEEWKRAITIAKALVEEGEKDPCLLNYQTLTNTEILFFVLGYQGGTVHQLAQELDTTVSDILEADYNRMQLLCRKAQKAHYLRSVEAK